MEHPSIKYLPRYIEETIRRKLKSSGVLVISGPKYCGKTTTATRFANSIVKLNSTSMIKLAELETKSILIGEKPRLIDEWQLVPDIWNEAKSWIDENPKFGQFILTGSSTPVDKSKIYHSGAGRITTLKMRPMSLAESLDSKGIISLKELFENSQASFFDINDNHKLADTAFYICRGGWPLSLQEDRQVALDVTRNYYEGLFNFENSENTKFRGKKPEIMRMLVRSYARNISSQVSFQNIIRDLLSSESRNINEKTVDDYIEALEDLFIVEDISAWNTNLRSKTIIRSTPTRHFVDTSIACASLGITPNSLMCDLNTFGLFFEDMAVRDLKIYAESIEGKVYHYRDSRGLECDAVIHLDNGKWALIEIKLGGEKQIEEAAANLLKLKDDIISVNDPYFMMVLTATGPAYRRKDGILVVPINCLKA